MMLEKRNRDERLMCCGKAKDGEKGKDRWI